MADFLDIFGEDFVDVMDSLEELPPDVEDMLLGVMDNMVYDVETFSTALEKTVFSMNQQGASEDTIKQTLANDMETGGRIFGQLRNDTKASIVSGINQSAKMGQYENYDLDKGRLSWVTVGGHRVCDDCDGRAGVTLTFKEWESEGIPGSGWSVCQGFCYCVLDPTGKASKKIDAPVREKGAKRSVVQRSKITKAQADKLAMKFTNMAKKQDEILTKLSKGLAADSGTALHGLKYRLKNPRSTSRKIMLDSAEDGISYTKMAKDDLSDLNRFTFILDQTDYLEEFNAIMDGFEADGYDVVKVKNYWEGDLYKGLNVNLRARDGRKVEFQFNTERSQFIKDKFSHKWYEEYRDFENPPTDERKTQLEGLLTNKWLEISLPDGHDQIPWFP